MDPFLLQFGQKQHPVVRIINMQSCEIWRAWPKQMAISHSELNTVRFVNFVSRRTGKIARTESSLQRVQRPLKETCVDDFT